MRECREFGPCIDIATGIDVDQRHDVAEFIICFAPLLTCKKSLPDTCWTAMLSLLGVSEVLGEIVNDTECVMSGIMSTPPPLRVCVRLLKEPGRLPTRYALTNIDLRGA